MMRFALMTEPQQGMSYADQLASAKRAEANGFDTWFRVLSNLIKICVQFNYNWPNLILL